MAAPGGDDLAAGVRAGQRRALARAITLIESTHPQHRRQAEALLNKLLGGQSALTPRSLRLAVSGVPGAGKSTFIEALGLHAVGQGRRVAVLSIDPSSALTGGSILGDKTRMERLARHPQAFIRPSPAGTSLGGVARRSREALLLVEAAGFDLLIVETVGVGQSETAAATMTDAFLLLLAPGGGDELQGIKRGIMELADFILINKADGELLTAARHAAADYRKALGLLRPRSPAWKPQVALCSALYGDGVEAFWRALLDFQQRLTGAGVLAERRAAQALDWLRAEIRERLLAALDEHSEVRARASGAGRRRTRRAAGRRPPPRASWSSCLSTAGVTPAAWSEHGCQR